MNQAERDYLFANAPLVEVVAEVRWKLQSIGGFADGPAVDPHFSVFSEAFQAAAATAGFAVVEKLVPDVFPIPMLAHKVVRRYRKTDGGYPLFQIGPGILSINMVPPYRGWAEFSAVLRKGLELLGQAYPMPDRYLALNHVELRYIDAFTAVHGVKERNNFILEELGVVAALPERIIATSAKTSDSVQQSSQAVVALERPKASQGILQIEHGTANGENAVIATLVVRRSGAEMGSEPAVLAAWFDDAHKTTREWFDALLTDSVRIKLGQVQLI